MESDSGRCRYSVFVVVCWKEAPKPIAMSLCRAVTIIETGRDLLRTGAGDIKKMTINNKEEERVELNNRDASQFYEREGEEGLLLLAPSRS